MDAQPPQRGGTPRDDEWSTTALVSAFTHAPIGMALCTPVGDVVEVNRALCDLVGLEAERLRAGSLFDVTYPDDLEAARGACARLRDQRTSVRHESRLVRADGTVLPVLVSTSWVDASGPAHLVMHIQDLSDVKAREQRLHHQATHDGLTGLVNREHFASRLGRRRRAADAAVMVLYVDLDDFKPVNDRWGHAAGDRLLALLAERLLGLVRSGDTVARLGGDEFALLCDVEAGSDVAAELARRVVEAVHQPFPLGGAEVTVTASVGGAVAGPATAPEELLHAADLAMYQAKAAGGDRYVVTAALSESIASRPGAPPFGCIKVGSAPREGGGCSQSLPHVPGDVMPANDQPRSRVEVDEDGTVVASAEVELPEGSPAARAALHVESGHHAPGTSSRLVDAVLETKEVREAGRLVAAVPKGDAEAIEHVHERIPSATTRPAGSSVIVEAELGEAAPQD